MDDSGWRPYWCTFQQTASVHNNGMARMKMTPNNTANEARNVDSGKNKNRRCKKNAMKKSTKYCYQPCDALSVFTLRAYEHARNIDELLSIWFFLYFFSQCARFVCVCGGYFESVDPLAFWALFRQLGKLISLPFFHLLPLILDDSKYASVFFFLLFGLKRTDDELRSLVFFLWAKHQMMRRIFTTDKKVFALDVWCCLLMQTHAYTYDVWWWHDTTHMETESHVLCYTFWHETKGRRRH